MSRSRAPDQAHVERWCQDRQREYSEDWERFKTWCEAQGRNELPAAPETVVALIRSGMHNEDERHRIFDAISIWHYCRDLEDPTQAPVVRDALDES